VLLWELLTEKEPYEHLEPVEAGQAIIKGQKLEVPSWTPPEYAAILKNCWEKDPQKRPSCLEIYERWEVPFLLRHYCSQCSLFLPEVG